MDSSNTNLTNESKREQNNGENAQDEIAASTSPEANDNADITKARDISSSVEELVLVPLKSCLIVENVKEYVRQIENLKAEKEKVTLELNTMVKNRLEMTKETQELNNGDDNIVITDVENWAGNLTEIENAKETQESTPPPTMQEPQHDPSDRENKEIADRFRQIMEMFDNFTKNLESLDIPVTAKTSPNLQRRRHSTSSKDSKDITPRVHRSRYTDYLMELNAKKATAKDIENYQDGGETQTVEASSSSYVATEVKNKDIATAVSGIHLATIEPTLPPTVNFINEQESANCTIACQTITGYQSAAVSALNSVATSIAGLSTWNEQQNNAQNDSQHQVAPILVEPKRDITEEKGSPSSGATLLTDLETDPGQLPSNKYNSDESGLTLVKLSEPPSMIELTECRHRSPSPCERTFHTIHIEAVSMPSSSLMQRPPLCRRLLHVLTDLGAAICLCLRVNKDCLFCIGFFIAFVVSASFLTAFFYRTLDTNTKLHHQAQLNGVDTNDIFLFGPPSANRNYI